MAITDVFREPTMYLFPNGSRMKREYGVTPNGNPLNGRWVLRDKEGKWLDFNQYRSDLAEHNNLNFSNATEVHDNA